ncbi:hypothetical protein [Leptolyngbya sp. Heron Island J]|uniref:hypothetical protein n=1 Tax=Leptolyngbya sp. Heron Island J TaxID=1385935 RepID=UPI0004018C9F|nr:hypothetical protein [Leptolyngbya sp. Heron Island J]
MLKVIPAALLIAVSVSGLTGLAQAEQPLTQGDTYPVISQLELRDRTVTITSHPSGYRYSIADRAGTVLSAALTEQEMADQYPGLFDLLQPAVAGDDDSTLMMLAPIAE